MRQGSGSSLELSSQLFFVLRRKRSNGIKNSFPKCAGAALVHSAVAAPWPSPACRTSPTSSTWPPSTAASGRPPISETLGIRFSTTSPPAPSAPLPLLLPIRTLFTPAAAKDCSARILRPAMASTNPPTPENPGRICKTSTTHSKSPRYSSTRKIPIAFSSPLKGILTARTPSAAFSVPPTVANPSRKFSTRTKTPAPPISPSIPRIRRRFMRYCGPRVLRHGRFAAANPSSAPAAAFLNPTMAEATGVRSPLGFRERATALAASELPSRTASRTASMPPWSPRKMPASTVPMIPANHGNR